MLGSSHRCSEIRAMLAEGKATEGPGDSDEVAWIRVDSNTAIGQLDCASNRSLLLDPVPMPFPRVSLCRSSFRSRPETRFSYCGCEALAGLYQRSYKVCEQECPATSRRSLTLTWRP
jgi:hypothetical protein